MPNLAVYQTELPLLPDIVLQRIAQLELALKEHTDYKQVQLSYGLNPMRLPTVHVIVEVPTEEEDAQGR